MGVRCSLLGHSWTTREERGETDSQAVVDRVVRECARCDTQETLKERKHVSISEAEDTMTNEKSNTDGEPIAEYDEDDLDDDEIPSPSGDDAVIIDSGSSTSSDTAGESAEESEDNSGFVQKEPETNKDSEFNSEAFNGNPNASSDASASGSASDGSIIDGQLSRGDEGLPSPSRVDGESMLSCPQCGFSESAEESSRREGDGCPKCRREYLELK